MTADCRLQAVRQSAFSDGYALLCYLLQSPTQHMLDELDQASPGADMLAIAQEIGAHDERVTQACACFDQVSEEIRAGKVSLTDFRAEYTRLFRHPKHPALYPYEALFLDAQRVSQGQTSTHPVLFVNAEATDAKAAYKAAGFAFETYKLPADHITIELEFMAKAHFVVAEQLVSADADAAYDAPDAEQLAGAACADEAAQPACDDERLARAQAALKAFRSQHVANWMPAFFDALANETTSTFYRGVALFGCVLTSFDQED